MAATITTADKILKFLYTSKALQNAVYDKIETLSTGAIRVEDEGTSVVAAATALNFAGAGVTVTDAGANEALVTISSSGGTDLGIVSAANSGLIRTF